MKFCLVVLSLLVVLFVVGARRPLKSIQLQSKSRVIASKSDVSDFGTLATVIVQDSYDVIPTLLQALDVVDNVTKSFEQTSDWINYFTFWEFDNRTYRYVTKSPYADIFSTEFKDDIDERKSAPRICQDLQVLDTLIEAFNDPDAFLGMQILLIASGKLEADANKLSQVFKLAKDLDAKIHVLQTAENDCVRWEDESMLVYLELASKTDLQKNDCSGEQKDSFDLDSEASTITLRFYGKLKETPDIFGPKDFRFQLTKLYQTDEDTVYVVSTNEKSQRNKLPLSSWNANYKISAPSYPIFCGLRVDIQTDI